LPEAGKPAAGWPPLCREDALRSVAPAEGATGEKTPQVNLFSSGSDTVLCEDAAMMTTLTVLATLVAVPLLFGVLLAVALGAVMTLNFVPDWVRGLRSWIGAAPVTAA
jgi:hypothetical protein